VRRVGVAKLRGERGLHVEDDAILATAGDVVKPDAQVLQQPLVLRELTRVVSLDQSLADEIARFAPHALSYPACASDPLDDLQVAQAAGRFLEVRLERVGRVLVLGVALLLFELFRLEERHGIHGVAEALLELAEEGAVATEKARLEERGAHRYVFRGGLEAAVNGAHA